MIAKRRSPAVFMRRALGIQLDAGRIHHVYFVAQFEQL